MTKEQVVERLRKGMQRSEAWSTFWSDEDADRLVCAVLAELKVLGLVIVPRDPDEDMDHAGFMQMQTEHEFHASDVWRAMLAASPYD